MAGALSLSPLHWQQGQQQLTLLPLLLLLSPLLLLQLPLLLLLLLPLLRCQLPWHGTP